MISLAPSTGTSFISSVETATSKNSKMIYLFIRFIIFLCLYIIINNLYLWFFNYYYLILCKSLIDLMNIIKTYIYLTNFFLKIKVLYTILLKILIMNIIKCINILFVGHLQFDLFLFLPFSVDFS